MGLCAHCKAVQIAWNSEGNAWVAYVAAVDSSGQVARTLVNTGNGRTARRTVPDLSRRHYPHVNRTGGPSTPDECPAWTLQAARAHKRAKTGKTGYVPNVPTQAGQGPDALPAALQPSPAAPAPFGGGWTQGPAAPSNRPEAGTIPVAASVGQATLGQTPAPQAPVAPPPPPPLPSVATLMKLEDRMAWKRAEKILECRVLPTRLMLWGPPGTGKTELFWRHAKAQGWQHEYQLMTEETPGSDLTGHLAVEAGNTVWLDGSLGRAIRKSHAGPVILVIDEIGRASADALSACLLALTNPESLRLTTRAGEVIAPKTENWHVGVTSNDDPALLPPAIADRLHLCVMLAGPNPELVESLTTVEARRLACAVSREYSIRALLSYDRLRAAGWDVKASAELVWEPQVARSFQDALKVAAGSGAR